ncbi:HIRAN domain-containing protein [Paenibacillus sp. FSL P2-0089]|uniref:HIRAN domain-containing protein n=1 Tax=Paenibacillus sp. FSL P2-0089 TaxID=2954526 RepID=UPI003159E532
MFEWLFGKKHQKLTMNDIDSDYRVVGVSFDNSNGTNRQTLLKKCTMNQEITLKRKRSKEYPNAIEVWSKVGQLGHIADDDAIDLAEIIDNGTRLTAKIKKITGGTTDKPSLGCIITIQEK